MCKWICCCRIPRCIVFKENTNYLQGSFATFKLTIDASKLPPWKCLDRKTGHFHSSFLWFDTLYAKNITANAILHTINGNSVSRWKYAKVNVLKSALNNLLAKNAQINEFSVRQRCRHVHCNGFKKICSMDVRRFGVCIMTQR